MANESNAVDWLTLGAAVVGTITSAFTAVWATKRKDREVFDVPLDWEWIGSGEHAELPFIYIHNRSENSISIVELSWMTGAVRRKQSKYTALFNEDPSDVNFPYAIGPGDFKKLFLESSGAVAVFEKSKSRADLFGFVRRSSVWLKVVTMRGNTKIIGAERAMPWVERPSWITGEKANA